LVSSRASRYEPGVQGDLAPFREPRETGQRILDELADVALLLAVQDLETLPARDTSGLTSLGIIRRRPVVAGVINEYRRPIPPRN
jgi:hypothetical protein